MAAAVIGSTVAKLRVIARDDWERTSREMALIICPFLAIGATMKIMEPTYYASSDLRNEMAFRLVFYGAFIAFATAGFVLSLRWLLNDRRDG